MAVPPAPRMPPLPMFACTRPNSVELVVTVSAPVAVRCAPVRTVVLTVLFTVAYASAEPSPAPEKLLLPVTDVARLADWAPTSTVRPVSAAASYTVVRTVGDDVLYDLPLPKLNRP